MSLKDAGEILAQRMMELMRATGVPNGLTGLGYKESHCHALTDGAMPQRRLLDNAPKSPTREDVFNIYNAALQYW